MPEKQGKLIKIDSDWSQNFSNTSLVKGSGRVSYILERNSLLVFIPVLIVAVFVKRLTVDVLLFTIFFLLTMYSYMEVLPFYILCLPPIAFDFQSACYSLSRLDKCPNTVVQREEFNILCTIVCSHVFVLSKHHRQMAIYLLKVTGTQPQIILAGIMTLSFLLTIVFGQMLAFALLHPICTAVLEMVHNCKKITLSQEGAAKRDYRDYELNLNKLNVAVRLAMPFTITIATPAILFDCREIKRAITSDLWLMFVILPMALCQSFCVWIFLVGKFFGIKKYFEWKGTMEDIYLAHLIVSERENLNKLEQPLSIKIVVAFIYVALFRFLLRVIKLDTLFLLPASNMGMNENVALHTVFVLYVIFHEIGHMPLTLMSDQDDQYISLDVVYYVLASNMYCSNFQTSSVREAIWEYALVPEDSGFLFRVVVFTLTFTLITNFIHTNCLLQIWMKSSQKLIKELWFSECMATTIMNSFGHYGFMFPFSSSINLLAYSSGGIPKKQLFVCGTHVLMICYTICLLTLILIVPYFDFQYAVKTPGFDKICEPIKGRDHFYAFYNKSELL